jgi:hypothetical protein
LIRCGPTRRGHRGQAPRAHARLSDIRIEKGSRRELFIP